MRKYLLPKEGKFYKTNLHVHTTLSDGNMTPEEVKKAYKEKGYSIVAFSDHEIIVPHPHLTDKDFLAITSTEISINEKHDRDFDFIKTYHFNLLSKDPLRDYYKTFSLESMWLGHSYAYITDNQKRFNYKRVYSVEAMNEIIRISNEEGFLVFYNHPVWSLQEYSDYIGLEGLWGVEWYNNGCVNAGFWDNMRPIDDLLRKGQNVFPIATDDSHDIYNCFGGFVMVKAKELTYDVVFEALRKGDFYSSTKPLIKELYIENGVINIKCSPAWKIVVSTERRYTKSIRGENIEEVQIDINDYIRKSSNFGCKNPYIRITILDKERNAAHTRAYHLHELI